jgi:hypothetical protein
MGRGDEGEWERARESKREQERAGESGKEKERAENGARPRRHQSRKSNDLMDGNRHAVVAEEPHLVRPAPPSPPYCGSVTV